MKKLSKKHIFRNFEQEIADAVGDLITLSSQARQDFIIISKREKKPLQQVLHEYKRAVVDALKEGKEVSIPPSVN